MSAAQREAQELLRATAADELLRKSHQLTHRMHEAQSEPLRCDRCGRGPASHARGGSEHGCRGSLRSPADDLRAQRDLIDAEILRRCGELR